MDTIPEPLARLLAKAAERKAGGASWEKVAAAVGRSTATCRRWPARYPEAWRRLFRAAERQLVAEAGAESVLALRQMLRSEDEKVRRDVARVLVALSERLRETDDSAAPHDNLSGLKAYLKEFHNEALQALGNELRSAGGSAGTLADDGAAEPD